MPALTKKELWLRLHNYHFDHLVPAPLWDQLCATFGGPDASTRAFAHKVARKLGWSEQFAYKAIGEYKKFVYLGVISDFVVTPSSIIDKVWHEHLLFSRPYRQFCSEVIEYDFDHHPELIENDDQTGVFNAQYLDTLELYKKEFLHDPPHAFWGAPKFAEADLKGEVFRSRKKTADVYSTTGGSGGEPSLYESLDSGEPGFTDAFGGFEGGEGGGAGAGGGWSSGESSDGGDSGGDSGSSCSSSCGGGCGGD